MLALLAAAGAPWNSAAALAEGTGAPLPRPRIEARPNRTGAITHWLVAPPAHIGIASATRAPRNAREGQAAPGGGEWFLHAAPRPFVDLRKTLKGASKGVVWCAVKVSSPVAGPRTLTGVTYGALKVFLGGKLVLNKPQPGGYEADRAQARIELPKGETELALAVSIRSGFCGFLLALSGPDGLKPAAGVRVLLPTAAGRAPDVGKLLADSFRFLPKNYFVTPGRAQQLTLALEGGWPTGVGRITPRFLGPDGQPLPGKFDSKALDEVPLKPWHVLFQAPKALPSSLTLRCELTRDGKTLGAKTLRLYSLHGILKEAQGLEKQCQAARAQGAPSLPLTALALEKIRLWMRKLAAREVRLVPEVGRTLLDLLAAARKDLPTEKGGRDPLEGRTGYFERAYISPIDDSPQPYFVLAPGAYAKDRKAKRPLVIFLHGYVPEYDKHRWWSDMPDFYARFEKHGAFLAIPFGRSNTDFLGPGEVDVLDVVKEMKRRYPIDEDRVYLYGYSMGGMAVYSLGGHYPGLWAAAVVIAGRADSPLLMNTRGLASLHPFKQFLIRTDQPIDLCENFLNIPVRIYHGQDDTIVDPSEAHRMVKRLKEVGCGAELQMRPGDHWFGFDLMTEEEPLKWLLRHKRAARPERGKRRGFSVRFGPSRPFGVAGITEGLEPFEIEWKRKGKELHVLRLDGPVYDVQWLEKPEGPVHWPSKELAEKFMDSYLSILASSEEQWRFLMKMLQQRARWKTAARCGPLKEATYGPFLIVYGTSGGKEATARLRRRANLFAQEWRLFAKGRATVKADKDVTDQEKKTKNLFLFGEEQENKLHAEAAATGKLPFQVKDGKARIGKKSVSLKKRGMLYIYPSPFKGAKASCSVVIAAGIPYGQYLPLNHKLDLVPDFLVYGQEKDGDGTDTNKPVVAGFFDGKWKLDPKTAWWFVPGIKAAPPIPLAPTPPRVKTGKQEMALPDNK